MPLFAQYKSSTAITIDTDLELKLLGADNLPYIFVEYNLDSFRTWNDTFQTTQSDAIVRSI